MFTAPTLRPQCGGKAQSTGVDPVQYCRDLPTGCRQQEGTRLLEIFGMSPGSRR